MGCICSYHQSASGIITFFSQSQGGSQEAVQASRQFCILIIGSVLSGMGFVLPPEAAAALIAGDATNRRLSISVLEWGRY